MSRMNSLKAVIKGAEDLPTLPGVAVKILEAIQNEQASLEEIGNILSTDPPLSAKVLKIINSPFYGLPTKITSVTHAINLLGINAVKNLALSFSLIKHFQNGTQNTFDYVQFWKSSLVSAITAKIIALKIIPEMAEDAFFLGLLHDIGRLALVQCLPDQYSKVLNKREADKSAFHEAEEQIFKINHMEMGEYLVKSWGLPETFSAPIRYHHHPGELKINDANIDTLTKTLHLSSLFATLFTHSNKSLYLGQFEWFAKEYGILEFLKLDELMTQIHEQTMNIFPLFEMKLGSEQNYLEIIEKARSELINLSADSINYSLKPERPLKLEHDPASQIKKQRILIVDDEERNIRLLKAMLLAENYQLLGVLNGQEALKAVAEIHPDLILLDVMMPEMNGFEVCRVLKQDEKTRSIPVVIVTALSEKEDRIKAMEVGADDFLSKPVDRTELLIRVKSLLRIKTYHDELLDSFREIAAKNSKLQELEKVKEGLTHMIIHDLRNPLSAISGKIELLLIKGESLSESQHQAMKNILDYCDDLNEMIKGLLDIHKIEDDQLKLNKMTINLAELIDEVIGQFIQKAELKHISLTSAISEDSLSIQIDSSLIKRVIGNLLSNAIRHTSENGRVEVVAEPLPANGHIRLSVKDTGEGLDPVYQQMVFEKFQQVALRKQGVKAGTSGLGLTFCKLAVEAHGGKIWVESDGEGKGSNFAFTLPT